MVCDVICCAKTSVFLRRWDQWCDGGDLRSGLLKLNAWFLKDTLLSASIYRLEGPGRSPWKESPGKILRRTKTLSKPSLGPHRGERERGWIQTDPPWEPNQTSTVKMCLPWAWEEYHVGRAWVAGLGPCRVLGLGGLARVTPLRREMERALGLWALQQSSFSFSTFFFLFCFFGDINRHLKAFPPRS